MRTKAKLSRPSYFVCFRHKNQPRHAIFARPGELLLAILGESRKIPPIRLRTFPISVAQFTEKGAAHIRETHKNLKLLLLHKAGLRAKHNYRVYKYDNVKQLQK